MALGIILIYIGIEGNFCFRVRSATINILSDITLKSKTLVTLKNETCHTQNMSPTQNTRIVTYTQNIN